MCHFLMPEPEPWSRHLSLVSVVLSGRESLTPPGWDTNPSQVSSQQMLVLMEGRDLTNCANHARPVNRLKMYQTSTHTPWFNYHVTHTSWFNYLCHGHRGTVESWAQKFFWVLLVWKRKKTEVRDYFNLI